MRDATHPGARATEPPAARDRIAKAWVAIFGLIAAVSVAGQLPSGLAVAAACLALAGFIGVLAIAVAREEEEEVSGRPAEPPSAGVTREPAIGSAPAIALLQPPHAEPVALGVGPCLEPPADRPVAEHACADGPEAFELGLLLEARGDSAGAEGAYRRADERGHPAGAYRLGVLLGDGGDQDGAEAAYRRADERGHPAGASNLGVLLGDRGDADGAEAAYRRADGRGDPAGAFNVAVVLAGCGDDRGAEAAFRRADERGDPAGASNLGVLLGRRGDHAGAEAAFRRADERGDPAGAFNLGVLLGERGDREGAAAAWRRAAGSSVDAEVARLARDALSWARAA